MTKIKFYFTIFFLLYVFHANAQQTHVDSLKQQLTAAKADSVKIGLAYQISKAYSNTDPDSMVFMLLATLHHQILAKVNHQ